MRLKVTRNERATNITLTSLEGASCEGASSPVGTTVFSVDCSVVGAVVGAVVGPSTAAAGLLVLLVLLVLRVLGGRRWAEWWDWVREGRRSSFVNLIFGVIFF